MTLAEQVGAPAGPRPANIGADELVTSKPSTRAALPHLAQPARGAQCANRTFLVQLDEAFGRARPKMRSGW